MSAAAAPRVAPDNWRQFPDILISNFFLNETDNWYQVATDIRKKIVSYCQQIDIDQHILGHIIFIGIRDDLRQPTAYFATTRPEYHFKIIELLNGKVPYKERFLELYHDSQLPTRLEPMHPIRYWPPPVQPKLQRHQVGNSRYYQHPLSRSVNPSTLYPPIQLPPASVDYIQSGGKRQRTSDSNESIGVSQIREAPTTTRNLSTAAQERFGAIESKIDQLQDAFNEFREEQRIAAETAALLNARPALRPLGLYISGKISGTQAELDLLEALVDKFSASNSSPKKELQD